MRDLEVEGRDGGPSSGRDVEAIVQVGDRSVGRKVVGAAAIVGFLLAVGLKAWMFWLLVGVWPLYELLARRHMLPSATRVLGRVQLVGPTLRVLRGGRATFERDHTQASRRQVWHKPEGGAVVELDWRGGDRVVIEVDDPSRAEQLLRAGGARWNAKRAQLASGGMHPSLRALAWLLMLGGYLSGFVTLWWLFAVLVLGNADVLPVLVATAASGALVALGARATRERSVVVGTDGLAFEGRAPAFIPLSRVRGVERHPEGIELELAREGGDGTERELMRLRPSGVPPLRQGMDTPIQSGRHEDALRTRETLLAAIEAALAADRRAASAALAESLLRRGRALGRWAADLAELRSLGGASYRAAAIEPEALARLAETSEAPLEARIAATFAGTRSDDPSLRRRFRIAEDATADAGVRQALALASAGDLAGALRAAGLEAPLQDAASAEREAEAEAEALASDEQADHERRARRA